MTYTFRYCLCTIALMFIATAIHAQDLPQLRNLYQMSSISSRVEQHSLQRDKNSVRFDANVVRQIVVSHPIVCAIEIPLPSGISESVMLTHSSIVNTNTRFVLGTDKGDKASPFADGVRCYRGKTSDGSSVAVTVSNQRIYCSILTSEGLWGLSQDTTTQHSQIGNNESLNHCYRLEKSEFDRTPLNCGTTDDNIDEQVREILHQGKSKSPALHSPNELLTISIALEIDNAFMGRYKDTTLAIAYVLNLFEVSSLVCERDLNTKYEITNVRIWLTQPPYAVAQALGLSPSIRFFSGWWAKNMKGKVKYDAVHWLSYNTSPSGVASKIGGICTDSGTYALTYLTDDASIKGIRSNDVQIVLHEFGHVFGSPHTHSCLWQGGPIDNCPNFAENGPCEYKRSQREEGTIMSYCLMRDNSYPFSLKFHPQCSALIRSYLERVPCIGNQPAKRNGKIWGYIRDTKGNSLPSFKIILRPMNELYWLGNPDLITDSVFITKADGYYEYNQLAGGLYRIVLSGNYGISPIGVDEQSNTMGAMVMVNDTIVRKDWVISTQYQVRLITGDTTGLANRNAPSVCVMPFDTLPLSTAMAKMRTFGFGTNNPTLYLEGGKYIIFPNLQDVEYTPTYRIITLSDSTYEQNKLITFTPKPGRRQTYLGIAGERPTASSSRILPLAGEKILTGISSSGVLSSESITDSNGVFLSFTNDNNVRYATFGNKDRQRISYELSDWSNISMSSYSINLLYRRPRLSSFIDRYSFSSRIDTFNTIASSVNWLDIPSEKNPNRVQLPFEFRFGNSTYQSIDVWLGGTLSFGNTIYVNAYSNNHPYLYHPYPTGGILQVHNQFFLPRKEVFWQGDNDTNRTVRVWSTVKGIAPNRTFVVEWTFTDSLSSLQFPTRFSSQVQLHEGSNMIEYVYGDCAIANNRNYGSGLVGIQGTDPLDVHARITDNTWSNTKRGFRDATTYPVMPYNGNTMPQKGLTFRWSDGTNSVEQNSDTDELTISPNPAQELLTISHNSKVPMKIELLDALGKSIYTSRAIIGNNHSINIDGFADGIYYCRVSIEGAVLTRVISIVR
jgi:hypothetical protein